MPKNSRTERQILADVKRLAVVALTQRIRGYECFSTDMCCSFSALCPTPHIKIPRHPQRQRRNPLARQHLGGALQPVDDGGDEPEADGQSSRAGIPTS